MIMPAINADYLHYRTAAVSLRLAPESVRRYIHGGTIRAEKEAGTYFVSRAEIERFLRDRQPRGRKPKKKSE
jgi:hypothetical protein